MPNNKISKNPDMNKAGESCFGNVHFEAFDQTLDRYRIPPGGVNAFELISNDGTESQFEKKIDGLIVHVRQENVKYPTAYDGGATSPDCYSLDGEHGIGVPGGECAKCEYNQFSSGRGKAKACKNKVKLYIQCAGVEMPRVLTIPATSIQGFEQYQKKVAAAGIDLAQVMTRISLEKVHNSNGVSYCRAVFDVLGIVSDTDLAAVYDRYAKMNHPPAENILNPEHVKDENFQNVISFS